MSGGGLPHSEISGSTPACGFPELIAACHVLHRRSKPRHSPTALSSLTTQEIPRRDHAVVKERSPPSVPSRSGWRVRGIGTKPLNRPEHGGPERDRTADLLNANQALSQLSYRPKLGGHVRRFLLKEQTDGGPNRNCTCDPHVISTVLC